MKNTLVIKGFVEATLRDLDGNVISYEKGENTVVELSNNIVMDAIYPRLGSAGNGVAAAVRPVTAPITNNATHPTGGLYIGPTGVGNGLLHTQETSNVNQIGYICVGNNLGTDSLGNNNADANTDVAQPAKQVDMVDTNHDHTDAAVRSRIIDSVTFPTAKSVRFTTTFGTAQGNIAQGISEIALWTVGNNVDAEGFVSAEVPTATQNMRMFARKVLGNTITKTDDGTLDISYTLTFGA